MKKVYFLGIGGIAMANLACLLSAKGGSASGGKKYIISGSDLDTFGPSANLLRENKINYFKDHNPSHIKKFKPDIVVIGNAINRGNPSLEYVLNHQVPYCSMPELIRETLLTGKKPIVITGTSGKTTTTAITAWILKEAGLKPTALIGGTVNNLGSGFLNGNGKYVVLEGDEYNSSFYDSGAKFLHYRPYIGVINNIQPDHLDIYGNIDNIVSAFKKFVKIIPSDGLTILNKHSEYTPLLSGEARSKVITFGKGGNIRAENIVLNNDGLSFEAHSDSKKLGTIKSSLFGKHNIENILASITVGLELKIPFKEIAKALAGFKGVKRRLEIIHEEENLKIIDDFAHNPEKVLASLTAIRGHFPKHKIIAIFEPRTGSSRRKFFQDIYPPSFKPADIVYIAETFKKSALNTGEAFSHEKLAADLNADGTEAYDLNTADDIVAHLKKDISIDPKYPTIIIVMTSGEFDNIHKKLISLFK